MREFTYVITENEGIHARPAGMLVNEAKQYDSEIALIKGEKKADIKRIISLMSLGVKNGDSVTVRIEGADEKMAEENLQKFFRVHL